MGSVSPHTDMTTLYHILVCFWLIGIVQGDKMYNDRLLDLLSQGIPTEQDTQECSKAKGEYKQCVSGAAGTAMKIVFNPKANNPDWRVDQMCSYITEFISNCGDHLVPACKTQEEWDKERDEILKITLEEQQTKNPFIGHRLAEKCPLIKDYIDRVTAANFTVSLTHSIL